MVSCYSTSNLLHLKRTKGIRELGLDVSARAVRLCQESGVRAEVLDITRDDISRIGLVDVATVFEVLEHIPNPEAVLLSLQSIASRVLVSVPNTGYYIHRLRLMCGRFPRQWIQHPSEHLRFWTLHDFQSMAQNLGFVVEEAVAIRGQGLLAKVAPGWFAESLFFVLGAGWSMKATRSADDDRLAVSHLAGLEVREKLDTAAVPTGIAGKRP